MCKLETKHLFISQRVKFYVFNRFRELYGWLHKMGRLDYLTNDIYKHIVILINGKDHCLLKNCKVMF